MNGSQVERILQRFGRATFRCDMGEQQRLLDVEYRNFNYDSNNNFDLGGNNFGGYSINTSDVVQVWIEYQQNARRSQGQTDASKRRSRNHGRRTSKRNRIDNGQHSNNGGNYITLQRSETAYSPSPKRRDGRTERPTQHRITDNKRIV